jgi:hypothetical protein
MPPRFRSRPSYSDVVATVALLLAIGGGSTAIAISANKVGPKEIARNAVRSKHIKAANVRTEDLAPSAVGSDKVADNALTGADIDESTLAGLPVSGTATNADTLDGIDSTGFLKTGSQAGGDLSGPLSNLQLAAGSVGAAEQAAVPAARVTHSAEQSVADNAFVTLAFNTESGAGDMFDIGGLHDAVTNNSRLTAPVDGTYLVSGQVSWASDGTDPGYRILQLVANADPTNQALASDIVVPVDIGSVSTNQSTMALVTLNAGEFVQLRALQDNSSNNALGVRASTSDPSPVFEMVWLGP